MPITPGPKPYTAENSVEETGAERAKASLHDSEPDADVGKGAVEDDQPRGATPSTLAGQLGHRSNTEDASKPESAEAELKDNDTDFPEPGSSPEHSGQHD